MSINNSGLQHYHLRKRIYQKHEPYPHPDKFKRFYDKFIYLIVIIAPIANIPQLIAVWIDKNASGVSALSWFTFSGVSLCWFVYGVLHKDRHIILMNIALVITQILVAVGTLLYG